MVAEYDAAGTLLTEYVWMDDRPIAVIANAGSGSPVTYWVHTDHLERPVLMTDGSAAVVWQASYLPYGEVVSITGTATLDQRFPGQWFQLESGLAYNWHRHYDATTGRYLQPDPLGMPDGPSRYAYVENSPLMGVDRLGLEEIEIPITPMPSPFLYHPRLAEQTDSFHNFSTTLDRVIYIESKLCKCSIEFGGLICLQYCTEGALKVGGKWYDGRYELGFKINPFNDEPPVITHRFFRENENKARN